MTMEAFVLGTGGMMPMPFRALVSILLRREGESFLFDCGEGTQVCLRSAKLRWKKISTIFITHSHADHITGIPGLLMLMAQADREEPLTIIGPDRVCEYVEVNRKVLGIRANFSIRLKEVKKPDVLQEVHSGDGYTVYSFPGEHSRTVVGYTFVEDNRPGIFYPEKAEKAGVPRGKLWSQLQRGESIERADGVVVKPEEVLGPPRLGRKVSYVTDTRPTPIIAAAVAGSDMVFCEGMYAKEESVAAKEKQHMTGEEAAKLMCEAKGVRRMGMVHFSPRYMTRDLYKIEKEAQQIFSESYICRDGMHLPISYADEE